jgi:hypothetical protein
MTDWHIAGSELLGKERPAHQRTAARVRMFMATASTPEAARASTNPPNCVLAASRQFCGARTG